MTFFKFTDENSLSAFVYIYTNSSYRNAKISPAKEEGLKIVFYV